MTRITESAIEQRAIERLKALGYSKPLTNSILEHV
jgi:hypothetical protein